MPEPVTMNVKWDHEDEETRLLIAIRQLAESTMLTDRELARLFEYLARRARDDAGLSSG